MQMYGLVLFVGVGQGLVLTCAYTLAAGISQIDFCTDDTSAASTLTSMYNNFGYMGTAILSGVIIDVRSCARHAPIRIYTGDEFQHRVLAARRSVSDCIAGFVASTRLHTVDTPVIARVSVSVGDCLADDSQSSDTEQTAVVHMPR